VVGDNAKQDAIYKADKAVREAHGSTSLVSIANIGRGTGIGYEFAKLMTIAYNGYWNHNYNKWRGTVFSRRGELWGGGRGPPPEGPASEFFARGEEPSGSDADHDTGMTFGARLAMGAAFITALMIIPAWIHHSIRDQRKKQDDDEGIPWGPIGEGAAAQMAGTVPGLNNLVYAMIHGTAPQASAADPFMAAGFNVWRDITSKKEAKHPVSHAAQLLAYTTGFPGITNQTVDQTSFMNQVLSGKKEPENKMQWARGLLAVQDKGKRP
jgi:hypothetical protein